jgi:hypothetical protein
MKHYRIFIAITALVLASLACNALTGDGNESQDTQTIPEAPPLEQVDPIVPSTSNDNGSKDNVVSTDFPVTDDAFNFTDMGDGSIVFFTKMSSEDVMKFYRAEYTAKGYNERDILTTVFDGGFSIVFDGDPSGKAVVIQSVDMGDGSRTVAIRLEDV